MGWISPTGHNDPDSKWYAEANAYDDNLVMAASTDDIGYYVELTHAAILCNKIQIRAHTQDWPNADEEADIEIDVYYSSAWHNIFSGQIAIGEWVEKAVGSTPSVTSARVKCRAWTGVEGGDPHLHLVEFDFWEVTVPTATTQAGSSIAKTSATGNGNITDTGGEDASAWGTCISTNADPTTADTVDAGSGSGGVGAFTTSIDSLSSGVLYHVRAYATNSGGTGYGADVEFRTIYAQAASGALTLAGALAKTISKALVGTISSLVGTLIKKTSPTTTGALTLSGITTKLTGKTPSGYFYFSGSLDRLRLISISGVLTLAGTLVKTIFKPLSGTISSAGAFTKIPTKVLAGVVTSSGSLVRNMTKALAGAFTPTGVLTELKIKIVALAGTLSLAGNAVAVFVTAAQAVGGTLTLAGSLTKQTSKALVGVITSSSTLVKDIYKTCEGSIWYLAGKLSKATSKSLSGGFTPAGVLVAVAKYMVAAGGALTLAGSLLKLTTLNTFAGVLTSSGTLIKYTKKLPSGIATFSGSLARNITKDIAGTLTSVGTVSKFTYKSIAGSLTTSGAMLKLISKPLVGTLTSAGSLTKTTMLSVVGTIIPVGGLVKKTIKSLVGSLSLVGKIKAWLFGKPLELELSFSEELELELTFKGD